MIVLIIVEWSFLRTYMLYNVDTVYRYFCFKILLEFNCLTLCLTQYIFSSIAAASAFLEIPINEDKGQYELWEASHSRRRRLLLQLQTAINNASDQFLKLVGEQQSEILHWEVSSQSTNDSNDSVNYFQKHESHSETLRSYVSKANAFDFSAGLSPQNCFDKMEKALLEVQKQFDELKKRVDMYFIMEPNSEIMNSGHSSEEHPLNNTNDSKTNNDIVRDAVVDVISSVNTNMEIVHSTIQSVHDMNDNKQLIDDISMIWINAVTQNLISSSSPSLQTLRHQLEKAIAETWANCDGLCDIPHIKQMICLMQNELDGISYQSFDIKSKNTASQSLECTIDNLVHGIKSFSEIKRHVKISLRILRLQEQLIRNAAKNDLAFRITLQTHIPVVKNKIVSIKETLTDNQNILDIPVIHQTLSDIDGELSNLNMRLQLQAGCQILISDTALKTHLQQLMKQIMKLLYEVVALESVLMIAVGRNVHFVQGDLEFRLNWKIKLTKAQKDTEKLLHSIEPGARPLSTELFNARAVYTYVDNLNNDLILCIDKCDPMKGINTYYRKCMKTLIDTLSTADIFDNKSHQGKGMPLKNESEFSIEEFSHFFETFFNGDINWSADSRYAGFIDMFLSI